MKCPYCKQEVGQPKKYQIIDCKCGRRLIVIEINKVKELVDVTPDKEEK